MLWAETKKVRENTEKNWQAAYLLRRGYDDWQTEGSRVGYRIKVDISNPHRSLLNQEKKRDYKGKSRGFMADFY